MKMILSLITTGFFGFSTQSLASKSVCPALDGEYLSELKRHDQYESLLITQNLNDAIFIFNFEEGEGGDTYVLIADGRLYPSFRNGTDAEISVEGQMAANCAEGILYVRFFEKTVVHDLDLVIWSVKDVSYSLGEEGTLRVEHNESHDYFWATKAPGLTDPKWSMLEELDLPQAGSLSFEDLWYPL